jgi:hypothetical protein
MNSAADFFTLNDSESVRCMMSFRSRFDGWQQGRKALAPLVPAFARGAQEPEAGWTLRP